MIKAKETSKPVYQQVRDFLVDEISSGRLSAGMFLPSERSMCEHLEVSRDSIRRALQELELQGYINCGKNKRPVISGETGNLFSHNANSIAFISGVPFAAIMDRESNQLANVFLHILSKLDDKKLDPAFFSTENLTFNKTSRIKNITSANYGAIVYYPGGGYVDSDIISLLEESQSPVVVLEGYMKNDNTNLDTVELDNVQGGYLATEYLIKNGHKNIVHISFKDDFKWIQDRNAGFMQALSDYDFNQNQAQILDIGPYHQHDQDEVIKALSEIVKTLPDGTGAFCINDQIATWVTSESEKMGKQIPDVFSVIGFDNIACNGFKRPTTVSHMTKEIGIKAAKIIRQKMNSGNNDLIYKEIIKPKLIIRESVSKR